MGSNPNERDVARPRFYMDAVQNKAKSEAEGRPIFDDREMVEVRIPGDKQLTWKGYAEEPVFFNPSTREPMSAKERWPDHYASFKKGEQRATSGTPLEAWPNSDLTKSRVAEIKAHDILSVEELANLQDNLLGKLGMGARELREAARTYISKAKSGAGEAAMAARVAQLEEMVKRLSGSAAPAAEEPKEKALEDCSDAELKEFIKRETGEPVRGNPSRETLITRAKAIAEKEAA
jgi:hypothetical protein